MNRRGVALLLETVFGLGIFSIALVVSLGLIFVVNRGSDAAREYTLAEQVGRQYLEFYMAQRPVPLVPFNSGLLSSAVPYHTGQTDNVGDKILNLSVTATITPADASHPYADVLVNVTWDTGLPRQILLEGYIGKN